MTQEKKLRTSEKDLLLSIFRKNALDEVRAIKGAPIKQLILSGWILTGFFVFILIGAGVFLASSKYSRRETVAGQITPAAGSFRIASQLSGAATNIYVREGDFVSVGTPIALIAANQTLRNGVSLEEALKSIQESQRSAQEKQASAHFTQIEQQIQELHTRRTGLARDIEKLEDLKALLMKRINLQRDTVRSNQQLAEKGMVSEVVIRQLEDAGLALQQQLEQAERDRSQQQTQIEQIGSQLGRLVAEGEQARSEALGARESLKEKELNTGSHLSEKLLAPISGFVTALKIREGAIVSPEDTIAIIVPAGTAKLSTPLEVELWAPSRAIGFVKPGNKVRLMYDSFPYETFGAGEGVVVEISGSAIQPREILSSIETKEQLFRVRVRIAQSSLTAFGSDWNLTPGMLLKADLILEKQSLLQLLFEPLRAANKRFFN